MIIISQGSTDSIGLEILLKSLISNDLNPNKIQTVCNFNDLMNSATSIGVNLKIDGDFLLINGKAKSKIISLMGKSSTATLDCLKKSLELISQHQNQASLICLPANKNDFKENEQIFSGYTEYLRYKYKNELMMTFRSKEQSIGFITDHIPLKLVRDCWLKDVISKSKRMIDLHIEHKIRIKDVFIFGLNPHAGENGILGDEELILKKQINDLKQTYRDLKLHGFLPIDSFFLNGFPKFNDSLFIFPFHDSGLPVFKNFLGLNSFQLTLGLPFLRTSVMHGSGKDIYLKNTAVENSLNECLNFLAR